MSFKNKLTIVLISLLCSTANAQYNQMWIPDTLSGTNFNLTIKDTFAQIVTKGNQTITGGINGKIWGPTLFLQKGTEVHMNVHNKLNDSTTLHWHGMHLPAVMDGGPHQVIPPGTVWQPYWKVTNNASTLWYHPHLHEMTEEQITKGIGGLIIVRDSIESALNLPREYGTDDIPLVLTDRDFNTSNQFSVVPYGDSMLTNMTLRAKYTIPAQVVRFRVLNGAIERSYNLGFSDNRTFYVIASDGGLLNAPVPLTRYQINAGERIEILVNCTGQSGSSVDLKAYNSALTQQVPGGDVIPVPPFVNFLARKDFNILHLNIGNANSKAITSIPTQLATVDVIPTANANITRYLTINDTNIAGIPGASFLLNHKLFKINKVDYTVPLNNTEIWQITNSGNFGHPFHIHDVEFNIISASGAAPAAAQAGWKDVVFVPAKSTVKFIAKFDDYADASHPFMFHCHIALHEDEGMMGQFVVNDNSNGIKSNISSEKQFSVYPNPANNKLFIKFNNENASVYYVSILDNVGRTVLMLPQPDLENGIDVGFLSAGTYTAVVTAMQSKQNSSIQFIIDRNAVKK